MRAEGSGVLWFSEEVILELHPYVAFWEISPVFLIHFKLHSEAFGRKSEFQFSIYKSYISREYLKDKKMGGKPVMCTLFIITSEREKGKVPVIVKNIAQHGLHPDFQAGFTP